MPDFTLQPEHTLIAGMTGSGKTTFVNRYLLNAPDVAVRTIFDDLKRMRARLQLRPCYSAGEIEAALGSRWVLVDPERMFPLSTFTSSPGCPTPAHKAFRWWCAWNFALAQRGPGRKLICLPEMWRFCTADSIPPEFAILAQAGRELGINLVMDTSSPEKINPALDGQITEIVCFRIISAEGLRAVKRMGADPEIVRNLPMGSFASWNRISGACLRSKVF